MRPAVIALLLAACGATTANGVYGLTEGVDLGGLNLGLQACNTTSRFYCLQK